MLDKEQSNTVTIFRETDRSGSIVETCVQHIITYQSDSGGQESLTICDSKPVLFVLRTSVYTIVIRWRAVVHLARMTIVTLKRETSTRIVLQLITVVIKRATKVESASMVPPPASRMHCVAV
jgi:hypothetical protein